MGCPLAFTRLVKKLTVENLWLYILRMLLEKPMYAYEMKKVLKDRFDVSVAMITVYIVLYKMAGEGLIKEVERVSTQGRPSRKYYGITSKGREALILGREFIEKTLSKLS